MACLPPAADAPHPLGLLRARGERPSSHRSAEQRDEVASVQLIELHSIPARAELQDIESARDSQEVLVLSRLQSRLRTHLPFLCDTLGLLGKAHMSPLTRGSLRLEQTGRTPMTMRPDPTFHASPRSWGQPPDGARSAPRARSRSRSGNGECRIALGPLFKLSHETCLMGRCLMRHPPLYIWQAAGAGFGGFMLHIKHVRGEMDGGAGDQVPDGGPFPRDFRWGSNRP